MPATYDPIRSAVPSPSEAENGSGAPSHHPPGNGNGRRRTRRSNGRNGANGSRRALVEEVVTHIEGQLPLEREAVMKAVAEGRAMGQAELARYVSDALGVAPSTAVGKIRTLEREGAIVGYRDGRRKAYLLPEPEPGSEPAGAWVEPQPADAWLQPAQPEVHPSEAWEEPSAGAGEWVEAAPAGFEPAPHAVPQTLVHDAVSPADDAVPVRPRLPRLRSALRRGAPAEALTAEAVAEPPRRSRLARAVPIVLVVVGTLLLAEGAITVLWQEPFTAISTARSQDKLDGDLENLEARQGRADAARLEKLATQRKIDQYLAERAAATNKNTQPGEALGRLKVNDIDLNVVMVQSTAESSLTKGPAHYTETVLPGMPGIMGIAGHRTTYSAPFRNINELEPGDEIVVTMPYGRFRYSVAGTTIVDDEFGGVFTAASFPGRQLTKRRGGGGNGGGAAPIRSDFAGLALTACHPLYSAAQRIVVYARLKDVQPAGKAKRIAAKA